MNREIYPLNTYSSEGIPPHNAIDLKMKAADDILDISSTHNINGDVDCFDISRYIQSSTEAYKPENGFSGDTNSKHYRIIDFEKRNLRCPHCTYVTDRKNNLKRHIVTMHQECPKTLDCCGIVFRSKAALREHVSFHHRGGYRCQICGRNFCRKALLRRHLTVHSGQKDFRCEHCAYATSHKSNLERHQKVHTKDGIKLAQNNQAFYDIETRENRTENVSNSLTRWRKTASSLQEGLFRGKCDNSDMGDTFAVNDVEFLHESRMFNWMNFHRAFSALCSNHCASQNREDDNGKQSKENVKNTGAQCDDTVSIDNKKLSDKESFAQYLKQYITAELDVNSNNASNDSHVNEESENEENLCFDKNERRRCRLSKTPYKCSACGMAYSGQRHFLKHTCGQTVKLGLYFPVTNMIKKSVTLAERNAKINSDDKMGYQTNPHMDSKPQYLPFDPSQNRDCRPKHSTIHYGYTYVF